MSTVTSTVQLMAVPLAKMLSLGIFGFCNYTFVTLEIMIIGVITLFLDPYSSADRGR